MAEDRMMTPADVVAQVMGGERGDWLRDAVTLVAQQLMEAEIEQCTGAVSKALVVAYAVSDAGVRD